MKSKIKALFVLYFIQFLFTACCNCGPERVFEVSYDEVIVNALDISGFSPVSIEGEINKSDLGIQLYLNRQVEEFTFHNSFNFSKLGIQSANATSCDCPLDEYIYLEKIETLKIYVQDADLNTDFVDVTDHFRARNFESELIEVNEFISLLNEQDFNEIFFQLELIFESNISSQSLFKFEVSLDSGKTLTTESESIAFKD